MQTAPLLSRSTDRSWATGVLEALSNHHSRLSMDNEVRLHHNRTTPTTLSRLSMSAAADPRSPESAQLLDHELEMVRGDMVRIGSAMESSQARLLKELSKAQEEIDRKSPPLLRQELDYSAVAIDSTLLSSKSVNSRLEPGMIRETIHGYDSIYSSPLKNDHNHGTVGRQALGHIDSSKHHFGTPFGTPSGKGQMMSPASIYTNPSVMKDEENVIQYERRSHQDRGQDIADIDHLRISNRLHISSEAIESIKVDGSSDAMNHYISPNSKGIEEGTVDTDEEDESSSNELQSLLQDAYLELNAARAELAVSESCNEELKKKSVAQAQGAHSMLESIEAIKLELKLAHEMLQSNKKQLQEMHGKAENAESQLVKSEAIGKLLGSTVLQTQNTLLSAFYSWSRTTVAMRFSTKEREFQVLPNFILLLSSY